ncbi:carboxypeptidase regulatory-like domain-containing protein [Foetidibacter luteolus]|uniref:carboxypeptidase regulatory-like domain-containing protein n=1 Tax=Foetidibacter luteolus TaxID=2608880 RepID=UPI00129B9055|nr:carboxypeptidase regulatory-like domain-containing protein [Foetidibacter luteolus]
MKKTRIFLASSSELRPDREQLQIFINNKNKEWVNKGVFLEMVLWEDFTDAMSKTRLQDEYNKAIAGCDIFILLLFTKIGMYTAEEFESAFAQFKTTGKPLIYTYIKDLPPGTGTAPDDITAFKERLQQHGHFFTAYKSSEQFVLHFNGQLEKLAEQGVIRFKERLSKAKKRMMMVVAAIIIIVTAFIVIRFGPKEKFTGLTVFVHGKKGRQDIVLQQGKLVMDVRKAGSLQTTRLEKTIGENGEVNFQNLPVGGSAKLEISFSEPYQSTHPDSTYQIKNNGSIYLEVTLRGIDKIKGTVTYNGNPLPGVTVKMDSLSTLTNEQGAYLINVPEPLQAQRYTVYFYKEGFATASGTIWPQTDQQLDMPLTKNSKP